MHETQCPECLVAKKSVTTKSESLEWVQETARIITCATTGELPNASNASVHVSFPVCLDDPSSLNPLCTGWGILAAS